MFYMSVYSESDYKFFSDFKSDIDSLSKLHLSNQSKINFLNQIYNSDGDVLLRMKKLGVDKAVKEFLVYSESFLNALGGFPN